MEESQSKIKLSPKQSMLRLKPKRSNSRCHKAGSTLSWNMLSTKSTSRSTRARLSWMLRKPSSLSKSLRKRSQTTISTANFIEKSQINKTFQSDPRLRSLKKMNRPFLCNPKISRSSTEADTSCSVSLTEVS